MSADFNTDVLIIGSGPMGATTALGLATYGVRAHMVSRSAWLADSPRAHITNQRANEVFRDLGIDDEIARFASHWDVMGDTTFATSLAGPELIRMRTWGTGDDRKGDYLKASPCGMVDIIQPLLEPILLQKAAERGATFTFNTEYLGHEQDENGVTARMRDRLDGREYTIRAKYMVGADGARSSVVEHLGLPIIGQMARAGTVYTIFDADLSKYSAHRPSILNWIVTPDASFGEIGMGLLRAVRPWTRWIAGWGFDINKGEPDLSSDTIISKIRILIGDPKINIDIVRTSLWYVNQAYATEYTKGRVLCGGDAVHRHPPSSGLGMNTCVQDGHNLAWKLAYVIKGYAGPALLESYSAERAPVGEQIVKRANQSRMDYAPLNACFRVPEAANPVAAGIARFQDPGPEGVAARRAVQDALDLKQTEFNAQGTEMNQRYESGAVLADANAEPEVWRRDQGLYNQATTRPGAKIPHAWIVGVDGKRKSTLDVTGKGSFAVVTGLAGENWKKAVEQMNLPFLRVVVIGTPDQQDLYCEWQRIREIDEAGAVLVRPDGVVAWRQSAAASDDSDAYDKLANALQKILARNDFNNVEADAAPPYREQTEAPLFA
ncbi:2,4-dichlorophenol 6-monooxygenase [Rhodopseudomonas boonkerdii]|uniref:FAD-dependent monooxygenase n=1 Tax=Rhodopseudomonas boonkerdii TaxID=475937 RepID=UPI001E358571|nr:FAD-dependent monooxygenase [Rhodopseudomonas boonkerdii]UGV26790.1 2,4-dichlorophenol 6-monooxygenase [Rhodopseudomonas boonkerdii]